MERSQINFKIGVGFFYCLIFIVGIILHLIWDEFAQLTTPGFLLLLPLPLLVREYQMKNYRAITYFLIYAILTLSVEIIGVKTGLIFGEYRYGKALGVSLLEVPIVIGSLWATLLFSTIALVNKIISHPNLFVKGLIVGLLMLFIDLILEVFAVEQGYWSWDGGVVPPRNYAAWFLIGFLGALGWFRFRKIDIADEWLIINLCMVIFMAVLLA